MGWSDIEALSETACVNTILMHLGRYLQTEWGVLEFDKRRVIERYLESDPPFVDQEAFRLIQASLAAQPRSERQVERLRQAVTCLRAQINARLLGMLA